MARKTRDRKNDDVAASGELEDDDAPSRTARKRMSHDLRRLGEELVALRPERLHELPLSERLLDAIAEARRLKSFGARRRQVQFVGKLMRQLDEESVAAIREALHD
jgi:ribosome-associated protein